MMTATSMKQRAQPFRRSGGGSASIRGQLMAVMIPLAIVPLIISIFLGVDVARQSLRNQSIDNVKADISAVRALLEAKTVEVSQNALVVASSAESSVLRAPQQARTAFLAGLNAVWGYPDISVFEPNGAWVAGTRGSAPSREVAQSDWFRQTLGLTSGQVYISDPEVAASGGQVSFNVATPIYNTQRAVVGVVRIDWNPTPVLRTVRTAYNDKRLDVLTRAGLRFASTEAGLNVVSEVEREPYKLASTQNEGVLEYNWQNDQVFASYAKLVPPGNIRGLDWVLILEERAARVLEPVDNLVRFSLLILVLGAAIVVAAAYFFSRRLAQPVDQLADLTAQVQRERDQLQSQISRLLDEVSTVAEGDLTVQAQVTADTLGSVADAFNYMVDELRNIIQNVNRTTEQVTNSTHQVLDSSGALAQQAEQQARRISEITAAVDDLSQVAQNVAENATQSAEIAGIARRNAGEGADAARQTMEGMNRIRGEVQETSKKIKRLGESSQEIGQIVQLIEDISDQTNLLALNAAIQAAMAGEHGRGFAVVADEVRRLAERAGVATKQISQLVTSIQGDTTEAVLAMENSTREVVEGSRLADSAGRRLEAINEVVEQLSGIISQITRSAERQAAVSAELRSAMGEISSTTRAATDTSRETAQSVRQLAELSEQLRASVTAFRTEKDPMSMPTAGLDDARIATAA